MKTYTYVYTREAALEELSKKNVSSEWLIQEYSAKPLKVVAAETK